MSYTRILKQFAFTLILLFISLRASAFYYKQYTTSNGLISNDVYHVFSDSKGYLWFCTNKGLSKFDGVTFKNYTILDGLEDNNVFNLFEDNIGRIWLFTYNGRSCYIYRDTVFNASNSALLKSLPVMSFINAMCNVDDSNLYVGYSTGQIIKISGSAFKWIYRKKDCNNVLTTICKSNNTTYSAYSGCSRIDIQNDRVINVKPAGEWRTFFYNNTLLVTDNEGLKVYINDRLIWRYDDINYDIRHIVHLYCDKDGYLFCSTGNGLVIFNIYSNKKYKLFNNFEISSVYQDIYNNYWVTSFANGIFYLSKEMENIKFIENISSYDVIYTQSRQLFFTKDNNLFSLSGNKPELVKVPVPFSKNYTPVFYYKNLLFFNYPEKDSSSYYNLLNKKRYSFQKTIKAIYPLSNNRMLSICFHGITLSRYKNNRFSTFDIIEDRAISKFILHKQYLYYVSGRYLYSLNTDNYSLRKIDSMPWALFITNIYCSGSYLFLFTKDGMLFRYSLDENYKKTIISLYSRVVYDFYSLNDSKYIISTDNGYYLLSSTIQGKISSMHKIEYPFRQTDIWFLYPYRDQLVCNINGDLYSINQKILNKELQAPKLFLESVITNGSEHQERNIVLDDVGNCNIILRLKSVHLNNAANTYQYRIINNNFTGSWLVSESDKINVLLSRYGMYQISVRSVTENNVASPSQTVLLTINPPFYHTTLFYIFATICIILLLVAIINILYAKRKKIFIKELNYLQLEHKAINSLLNPHFIFNSLNNIQELINSNSKEQANNYLITLSKMIRQNLENLQFDLISIDKELTLIRNYVSLQNLRFNDRIKLVINTEINTAENILIPPLLIHTFIENAIVHGFKGDMKDFSIVVNVNLSTDDYLIIKVTDNGTGIQNKKLQSGSISNTSMGINFTKRRLQRLSDFYKVFFSLQIETPQGNTHGTEVIIILYSKFKELADIQKDLNK
ncbi:MAG: histidine kinase [Bacteroidetes bacterium]|nr:histidine kinase [Bacteroidota bacterium]